jgi:NAD(P)-dependent dehydrogenase (short-subunit alcohol dehydrogenase family)
MDITGSVALVTGANRGLGKSFCASLLERGASKVYAGARDISSVTMDGVEPILLDITCPDDIEAAALRCGVSRRVRAALSGDLAGLYPVLDAAPVR